MADEDLPEPIEDDLPAWELDLATALGYTTGSRIVNGRAPTAWNLPQHPFAFLEDTREVVVWEVDGDPDETGMRQAHIDPHYGDRIAMIAHRVPIPDGFELVTVTDTHGVTHRIALSTLRRAAHEWA